MKHRTAAAKACGMEARMAPTFPVYKDQEICNLPSEKAKANAHAYNY